MKMRSTASMRVAKTGYLIMSGFFCLIGLLLMCHPAFSVQLLGTLVAAGMIVFGLIKIVGYFSKDLFRLAFQFDLELGILLAVLGLILLLHPIDVMTFLFIAVGIAILADALFKLRIARDAKRFGISQWWVSLVFAILTALVGLLLVIRPFESMQGLMVLLGAALVVDGILNLCVALSMVKIVRNQYPDIIDAEFEDVEPKE